MIHYVYQEKRKCVGSLTYIINLAREVKYIKLVKALFLAFTVHATDTGTFPARTATDIPHAQQKALTDDCPYGHHCTAPFHFPPEVHNN